MFISCFYEFHQSTIQLFSSYNFIIFLGLDCSTYFPVILDIHQLLGTMKFIQHTVT
jgi:hypothetical protein